MNNISLVWNAVNAALTLNKTAIGITGAESAESGKMNFIKAPSALTWMDFESATTSAQGKLISIKTDLYVFCGAESKKDTAEAIQSALDIAVAVLDTLSGHDMAGSELVPADPPLEIVKKSSTDAVVCAMFKAKVRL